jgi:hypothetical protein
MVAPKNQKRTLLNGLNPLSYQGVEPSSPTDYVTDIRDPISGTTRDYAGFDVGDEWENRLTNDVWKLVSKDGGVATWLKFIEGDGDVKYLTDDADTVVNADAAGGIKIAGGELINTVAGVNTLTLNLDRGLDGQIPIAATGGATIYANLIEGAGINITNGANSVTISSGGFGGDVTLVSDTGDTATTVAGSVNVLGTVNRIKTDGDNADTFTIDIGDSVPTNFLTDDTNVATPAFNILEIAGANTVETSSAGSTVTVTGPSFNAGQNTNTDVVGTSVTVNVNDTYQVAVDPATLEIGTVDSTQLLGSISIADLKTLLGLP